MLTLSLVSYISTIQNFYKKLCLPSAWGIWLKNIQNLSIFIDRLHACKEKLFTYSVYELKYYTVTQTWHILSNILANVKLLQVLKALQTSRTPPDRFLQYYHLLKYRVSLSQSDWLAVLPICIHHWSELNLFWESFLRLSIAQFWFVKGITD